MGQVLEFAQIRRRKRLTLLVSREALVYDFKECVKRELTRREYEIYLSKYFSYFDHVTQSCGLLMDCFTQRQWFERKRALADVTNFIVTGWNVLELAKDVEPWNALMFERTQRIGQALLQIIRALPAKSTRSQEQGEKIWSIEVRRTELRSVLKPLQTRVRSSKPAFL